MELLDLTVRAEAASRRTQPVPPATIRLIASGMTIAIMEIVRGGETIHVVTANSARAYTLLRANPQWLRPYERVLGERVPYAHNPEVGRRQDRGIDAEQVGRYVAIERGWAGSVVRIAASRDICRACIEIFEEFLRQVRLINPDPDVQLAPRRQEPPPLPVGGRWRGGGAGPIQGGGSGFTAGAAWRGRVGPPCASRELFHRGICFSARVGAVSRGHLGEGGLRA